MSGPPEMHVPALVDELGPAAEVLADLTAKQRRFVEEYLVDLNATQAAKRSGYAPRSAYQQGYENLKIPKIVDAIQAVMAGQSKRAGIDRKWVLAELVDAHAKVKEATTPTGVTARARVLELIGKHVDVRAWRLGLGGGGDDEDALPLWDLSRLSDGPLPDDVKGLSEFEVFERLLEKISFRGPSAGMDEAREGGETPSSGQEAAGGE